MAIKVYIPNNLDIENFLRENPPSFDYQIDNFKYILGLINELKAKYHDYDEVNNGFVNVNAATLQGKIHEYKSYLDYLKEYNIFWSDHLYVNGEKSTGYKFAPEYQVPVKEYNIEKWSLVKRHRTELLSEQELQCCYLDKWITGIEIDYLLAKSALKNRFEFDMSMKDSKATDRYNSGIINIERIRKGEVYFKRDSNVFRYHSILTSLSKDTRNFVKFHGQPLVSVDIKSSQPYLSCLLFDLEFYRGKRNDERFFICDLPKSKIDGFNVSISSEEFFFDEKNKNSTQTEGQSLYIDTITTNITQYLMLVKSAESHIDNDFYLYKSLIREGKLYEYIQGKAPINLKIKDRNDAKKAMFYMMFSNSDNFYSYHGAFKRFFAELFPNVFDIFELIKSQDYTLLATVLQTIESEIVINRACKRIAKERPKLFIATIHDSIVTTVGDEYYVEKVLREELTKAIGFEPSLEKEYWCPENSIWYPENSNITSSGITFTDPTIC